MSDPKAEPPPPQEKRKQAPSPRDDDSAGDTKPSAESNVSIDPISTDNNENDDEGQLEKPRKRRKISEVEISAHNNRWNEMFERLVAYKKKHGNCLVPNRYNEDPPLGHWVSSQRRQYKTVTSGGSGSTAMTVERAKKLMDLGFEWSTTDPRHVPWEVRYRELCDFVQKNGHANVPMRWKDNIQLSNWVSKQRHDYKLRQRGTSQRLTGERFKLLNEIGFVWEATTKDGPIKGKGKGHGKSSARCAKNVVSCTAASSPGETPHSPNFSGVSSTNNSMNNAQNASSANIAGLPQDANAAALLIQALAGSYQNAQHHQQQSSNNPAYGGIFPMQFQSTQTNNSQGHPGCQQQQYPSANAALIEALMTGNPQNSHQQQQQNSNPPSQQTNNQAASNIQVAGLTPMQLQSLLQNVQSNSSQSGPAVIALPFLMPNGAIGIVPILNSNAGQQLMSLLPILGGAQGAANFQAGGTPGSVQQTPVASMQSTNEPQQATPPQPFSQSSHGTEQSAQRRSGSDPPGVDPNAKNDD